jgi:hypothetical protein
MAKVRSFKQLQNHPLVKEIWTEYQPGVCDGTDYTYWLSLVDGYHFKILGQTAITEGTKRELINAFNCYTPTEGDGF